MSRTRSDLRAPAHLQPSSRKWWLSVAREFELAEHHVRLLTLCAEAWDRAVAARKAIDQLGLVFTDRHGAPRPRPEIGIERDSRVAFARLLRELDLDGVPPPDAPRPPAIPSNRDGRR